MSKWSNAQREPFKAILFSTSVVCDTRALFYDSRTRELKGISSGAYFAARPNAAAAP